MSSETQLTVSQLVVYPIKSCAGIEVERLEFDEVGPLHDRRYMVVNPDGRFLTQRQLPVMARIIPELTETGITLTLSGQTALPACAVQQPEHGSWSEAQVWKDSVQGLDCGEKVAQWLEQVLGRSARLLYLPNDVIRSVDPDYADPGDRVGFADGFPLLVTHQASADFLSGKLGRPLNMLRFRPNVVVSGGEAFDELNWQVLQCAENATGSISSLQLVKPCTRCVIPLRDLETLEREADVTEVLKEHCRTGKEIIFGQNALPRQLESIQLGSRWTALP